MQFDGQVWFSFKNPDVWVFYRFMRELASAGNSVSIDWTPLSAEGEKTSMVTFLAIEDIVERGRFLHAMLGLIHLERMPFDDAAITARALAASGAVPDESAEAENQLVRLASEAGSLGVTATPTLYRHGPASHIRLTEAALLGDVEATAGAILSAADDDGVWEITKP